MSLRRLAGSFVLRQRAAADAMELTAKIARYNPKFDWDEFDQNILIRPVAVGVRDGLRELYGVGHPASRALQLLRPLVAVDRSIRCHSMNIAFPHRQSQLAALIQGYVAAFAETCYDTRPWRLSCAVRASPCSPTSRGTARWRVVRCSTQTTRHRNFPCQQD
jgi:hypothetical protein